MAATGHKGIDVRQTGNRLAFRCLLQDSAGAIVTSGTTSLYLYELQDDGTLKSYDFSDNTFKTTALTTATAAMTHRTGNNGGTNTGLFTYVLSTLSGFTAGAVYFAAITNSGAVPVQQVREFQYGSAEGDLVVTAAGTGLGAVQSDLMRMLGTLLTEAGGAGRLAAAISTWGNVATPVATAAGVNQTGDSYARVGAAGAGLTALGDARLANLDASISSVVTAIGNLNNLSALINIHGSPLLEIPDASSTPFAFTVVVRDNEGKLVDLDGSPTLAAANAGGTDRSANLSAVSHPATGRYTFTYSVASNAAEESLRITVSGAVSSEGRYIEWVGAVVNYDTLTQINAIKAKTDNLPSDPASASTIAAAFSALQDVSTADILTALGTAGGLDAALALLATAATLDLVKAKTDLIPNSPAAVSDIPTLSQIFTTAMTQSYRATGAAPTLAQFVFEVLGHLTNSDIVDTLKTIYKLDKTTPAKTATLTFDGSGNPTAIEETT